MGRRARALIRSTGLLLAAAFSAAAPAAAAELQGVNAHPLWGGRTAAQSARELDLVKASGANTVRVDVVWSTLELAGRGQYDQAYAAKLDSFVAAARARGIRVIATVWSTPCWASSAPDSAKQGCAGAWWDRGVNLYPPTDAQDYGAISGWIADRWGGDLAAIEVWNEPNSSAFFTAPDRAAAYVPLVRAAYTSVDAEAPALPVVAGALVYADTAFLQRLYDQGIAGSYDAISIHPYDDPALQAQTGGDIRFSFQQGVPAFRQAMVDRGDGDTPLWLTEFGWPTCPPATFRWCTTPEQQAQKLTDTYAAIRGWPYVGAAIVYELRDGGTDPGQFEQNMGLVANDFTPKPAFDAFTAAMQPSDPSPPPADPPPDPLPAPAQPAAPVPEPPPAPPTIPPPVATTPPFAGASLRSRTATVRRGAVYLSASSAVAASGALRLTATTRGRTKTLGRATFALPAGKARRVRVRLSRSGLKLLQRSRRLTALATVTARDGSGASKTTRGHVRLVFAAD